jgi:hypothetical protein
LRNERAGNGCRPQHGDVDDAGGKEHVVSPNVECLVTTDEHVDDLYSGRQDTIRILEQMRGRREEEDHVRATFFAVDQHARSINVASVCDRPEPQNRAVGGVVSGGAGRCWTGEQRADEQ